jgi:ribonuclease Z
MDCGAGTYEQFVYQYTPEELDKKLMSLKVIFMTHLHADHNLGIVDLIKRRNDLIKRKGLQLEDHKLFVILPFNTLSWFYGYCKVV